MARNEQEQIVKGGPANHAADTDLDAPTPPGGPQRQDHPDGDVQPGPDPDPDRGTQLENAETSLDQPSDGVA